MNRFFNKIKCLTGIVVLIGLSFITSNTIINGHYHRIENGSVLWHSHPFQDRSQSEPYQNHTHTIFDLLFLNLISNLLLGMLFLAIFKHNNIFKRIKQQFQHTNFIYKNVSQYNFSLRAPPYSI